MGFSSHWNPIRGKLSFTISQRADQCSVEIEWDNGKIEEEESGEASIERVCLIEQIIGVFSCVSFCMVCPLLLASLVVPYEYLKRAFGLNVFSD